MKKKFWLSVLNDFKNRGVQNVLIFCVDGLNGFKEAIGAVYPFAKIQRCIIHQLRVTMKYIPYKDKKAFASSLKAVYGAVNEEVALENLLTVKEKWQIKYPNAIESLNSQYRKVTKAKLIFPNDESLKKMLYLATQKISKKWNRIYANWDLVINQLNILFDEVLNKGA